MDANAVNTVRKIYYTGIVSSIRCTVLQPCEEFNGTDVMSQCMDADP